MNKKLSEVTLEDAKEILMSVYHFDAISPKWKLTDESEDIKEPCKKYQNRYNDYYFWFFDDGIQICHENVDILGFENHTDVKVECYINAINLGYYVPYLSDLIRQLDSKIVTLSAILNNYRDEELKVILEDIKSGESYRRYSELQLSGQFKEVADIAEWIKLHKAK